MAEHVAENEEALPQLLGDFAPIDVWQRHMNAVFYGLRGDRVREFYQTFAAADYRLGYALAADYVQRATKRQKASPDPSTPGVVRPTLKMHGLSPPVRSERSDSEVEEGTEAQRRRTDPEKGTDPLTIMEWGCGNGNLAACFLDHVKALDRDATLYPRMQYVLIDASETVLDGARANAELAKHGDRVQFVRATVPDLQSYADGSVDRIFCNELWSELPTKLLLRKAGDVMEEHIRPNLKETRLIDYPDWPGLVQAFDEVNVAALKPLPAFLEDILWEREYHKIEAKDVPFRRLFTDFLKLFDEELLIPVNAGAAVSLREAHRLLAPNALGFSSFDAGTADEAVLNDPEKPCYNLVGGQFSFMVNLALLEDVAKQVGGGRVTIEPQKEFVGRSLGINVMSLMDVLASHPNLPQDAPWQIDRLLMKTVEALNAGYTSPYERTIDLPLPSGIPEEARRELEQLLARQARQGVPDAVAYLAEEEVMKAAGQLEELGYDRSILQAAFTAPPQPVDYFHFRMGPDKQ